MLELEELDEFDELVAATLLGAALLGVLELEELDDFDELVAAALLGAALLGVLELEELDDFDELLVAAALDGAALLGALELEELDGFELDVAGALLGTDEPDDFELDKELLELDEEVTWICTPPAFEQPEPGPEQFTI